MKYQKILIFGRYYLNKESPEIEATRYLRFGLSVQFACLYTPTNIQRFNETAIDRASSKGKQQCWPYASVSSNLLCAKGSTTNTRFTKRIGIIYGWQYFMKNSPISRHARMRATVWTSETWRMRSHSNAARTICRVYPTKRKYLSRFP